MELLKRILDSCKYEPVCFLCLKEHINTSSIHSKTEVIGDGFKVTLSIAEMLRIMIPSHAILFDRTCEDCEKLILQMFVVLHKYRRSLGILSYLCDGLDEQLDNIDPKNMAKVLIQLTEPEFEIDKTQENTTINYTNLTPNIFKDCKKTLYDSCNEELICEKCGETFNSANLLYMHIKSHKQSECATGTKMLKSPLQLNVKKRKPGTVRRRFKYYYKCNSCNYITVNCKSLEGHNNKVHLGVRPYVCEMCSKAFYVKSHMVQHSKTHSQIKNLACDLCGSLFANDKALAAHQILHTNLKPYKCSMCNLKFITSGRRTDHFKRAHMEKMECCVFCGKKFSVRKDLNRHIKKKHADIELDLNDDFEETISEYKSEDPLC